MRKFKIFNLIAVLMLSIGFVACEEDPEPGTGGEAPSTPGNTTLNGKVGEAVDLGLPSGKLWSSWNVGASSANECGNYYAWGEISTKADYLLSTYEHYDQEWQNYKDIGSSISKTQYDVATAMWGDGWHIPTEAEFRELINNCTWTWIQYNNTVWGYKVEGKNGNKIFLPATGLYQGTELQNANQCGYYWSESLSSDKSKVSILSINNDYSDNYYISTFLSYYGLAVRPVKDAKAETPGDEPEEPETPQTPEGTDIFLELEKDEMVFVEGGTFTMGATSEQGTSDPYEDEYPTHQVTLSDFYIGKYEVTQQLWEYVMKYSGTCADGSSISAYASDVWLGSNPSSTYGVGNYYPAYNVSWEDIVNIFIPRLNKITGKTFRLPTEAEWEYAARGGNKSKGYKYSGSNTIGDVAWYDGNSSMTHEVGTKAPNELGLYDMSGNVYEWCSDWYSSSYYSSSPSTNPTGPTSGSYRVLRGGGWYDFALYCRVSDRNYGSPDSRYIILGFRLVMP